MRKILHYAKWDECLDEKIPLVNEMQRSGYRSRNSKRKKNTLEMVKENKKRKDCPMHFLNSDT